MIVSSVLSPAKTYFFLSLVDWIKVVYEQDMTRECVCLINCPMPYCIGHDTKLCLLMTFRCVLHRHMTRNGVHVITFRCGIASAQGPAKCRLSFATSVASLPPFSSVILSTALLSLVFAEKIGVTDY